MAEFVTLTASDGFKLAAWAASPVGKPRGSLVVIQEIFGVNSHIRDMTERYAREGYLAIAPALFDRKERNFDIGYSQEDIARGREVVMALDWDKAVMDVEAARVAASKDGKVGIVGFCFGGTMAWVGACRLKFDVSVCYYGGMLSKFAKEKPACPVMMHFGNQDAGIPLSMVDEIRAAQSGATYHMYDAGHGFSCDQRASYDKASHELAWKRSAEFMAKYLR